MLFCTLFVEILNKPLFFFYDWLERGDLFFKVMDSWGFFIKSFLVRKFWRPIKFDRISSLLKSALVVWICHTSVLWFVVFLSTVLVSTATCILSIFLEAAVIYIGRSLRVVHMLKLFLKSRIIFSPSRIICVSITNIYIVQVTVSPVIGFIHIWMNLRNCLAFIDSCTVIENWIVNTIWGSSYCKSETASNCHFEYLFVFYGLQSSRMVSHLAITYTNFAVWIRAPDYSFVICIDDHEEWSSDIHTVY